MADNKYQLLGSVGSNMLTAPVLHIAQPRQSPPPSGFKLGPPLGKGQRGGVLGIAASLGPAGDAIKTTTRSNDDGAIKVALLLVDRIDKPANSLVNYGAEDSADVTGIGLGSQSVAVFEQGLTYTQAEKYVWETYCELEKREPGRWSLWPQYDTPVIPASLLTPATGFQLKLVSGLVVPSPSTPYDDVLTFKDRHRDELIALRHHLEEFAIKLSNEGDPKAVHLELERFDVSLAGYLKKARQSNVRKAVASLTTELDWAAAVRGAAGGGGIVAAAQGLNITAAAAAIGTGVLSALSIKSVAGLKDGPSPFRYIARIEREYGD